MRRMIDATKRAVKRVNSRLLLGGFVLAAVGAAALGGWSYTRPAPKGPTKQVATGVDAATVSKGPHQVATASLSDISPVKGNDSQIRQLQYSQPAESSSR